jgi:hypothetical protein
MPQRRLLHVDASGLTAYRWQAGRLRDEGRYLADDEGHAAFADYLSLHRRSLFYLLADLAEEGFQYETIPFVRGRDRAALLQRKLNQFYYGSPLTTAQSLGRESAGRRDERMLFAGLTRPQILDPWMAALRTAESQLAGVYSAPLLTPGLAKRLKVTAPRCMIVSVGRAGIRQTFLEDGKLRFSRLSPLASADAVETARACAAETFRLHQYLAGQRVLSASSPLPVLVLSDPAHRDAFDAVCTSSAELAYHALDLAALRRQRGLRYAGENGSGDSLYLSLLALQQPARQFAPPAERHLYRLWQARFALKSAGALAMAACLAVAGAGYYKVNQLQQQTLHADAETAADSRRYGELLQGLPPMPTAMENLRAVVARYDAMDARSATLQPLLVRISRALDASPEIEIERIDWEMTGQPEQASRNPRRAGAGTTASAATQDLYASATLEGTLPRAEAGNQRAMLQAVNRFAGELRRDPALRVSVLHMPVDVESATTLRSGGGPDRVAEVPHFSLRVSYAVAAATRP